jgi:hypothetical protein
MKVQNRNRISPMFLWAGFWMILLLSLLLPNPVSASTVASGITTNTATVSTHMRKSFYANGRYWVFYSDATNMVYKTSLDGVSWSLQTTIRAADSGNRFSVFFDGTYLHYAYSAETANTPIYYRRGTPNSNGTITWSAAEQTALAAVSTDTYNGPNISVATDGRAWIGYELYTTTGPARSPYVTRNNNTDGTWSVASGFPYQLRGQMGSIANPHCVEPVPLTTGYVFCVYGASGFTLRGKRWNGGWGTEKATTNAVLGSNGYSAVNEGDDVHLCFVTGSNPDTVIYAKYTYGSDSFGGETTIQSSPNGGLPAVSLNTTTNTLYCFWRNYNNGTHIYYKKKTQAGSWDSTATDWIDESTDGLTASDRLTSFYKDYSGKIGLVYMAKTSSPYKVRFEKINAKAGQRDPLLVYSQNGDPDIYYSRYTSGNWATGAVAADLGSSPRNYWKVAKTHPGGSSQAVVSVKSDNSLYVTFFDGSSWSSPTSLGTIQTSDYRCFDAAYEQKSGQLLIVAATGNAVISYWVWDGSSWVVNGANQSVSFSTGVNVNWARLASKPGSNEIALVIADEATSNRAAGALIWNGDNNSWGNTQQLSTNLCSGTGEEVISEIIGVEYMLAGTNAGKAVFAWAESGYIYGRVWNGTSYDSAQSKAIYPNSNTIRWIRLKADPNSDDMVVGFEDDTNYIYAITWTGTIWNNDEFQMTSAGFGTAKYNRCFDVIYEGDSGSHSGHIVFVYSDTSYIRYRHYGGSSWSASGLYVDAGSFQAYWSQLQRAPDNTVYLAIHETYDDLNTWTWNNTSWTVKNEVSTGLEWTTSADERVEVIYLANMPLAISGAPVITSLDYTWGSVGTSITITGYNFGYSQGTSTLTFYNNKAATVTSWDNTQIVVTVPLGATTGNVTITTSGGSDTESFTVITGAPTITTILPDKGSNFGDIDIAYVTGTNYSPGMTITLTKASETDILGTATLLSSSSTISTTTFDLTSKTSGLWNLVILNPDDQSVTGSNLFAIHPPVTVTSGSNAYYNDIHYPNQKHLVRDSAGNWYYVYGDGSDLYMTKCASGSTTWDSPTKLTGTGGIITTWTPVWNDVSVDIYRTGNVSNDRVHLVWRVSNDGTAGKYILYSKCNDLANYNQSASWSQVDGETSPNRYDQLDSTGFATQYINYVDISVDSGGYPHATWHYAYIGNSAIRYITSRNGTGGDWGSLQAPVTDSSDSGYTTLTYGYPCVDTNSSNAVHISYSQNKTSISKQMIRHMTASGPNYNSWTKTDVISDGSRHFYETSLIVDSNNRVYVVAKDDTSRDLFWAHYNGSTWSTNNNLTNGSFDIESAVVGAKMGAGITDHILLSKVYDASSNKKVIYWRWEYSTSNWSKYSEELDTGNESRSLVTIEKHAPESSKTMGYLFYDTSGDTVYFDQITDLGSNPTGGSYKMEKQVEMQMVAKTTASTSYFDTDNQQFFYHQSGNYDTPGTVSKFYFEAVIRASSGATAYAALYTAGGSYVTGTEVTTTSTSFTRVRSAEITLTNNTEYRLRIKTSSGGTGYLRNARIVVLQSSADRITKTETHALISGYNEYMEGGSGCCYVEPTYDPPHRFYLDKAKFAGTVSAYFEAVVGVTGGTGYVRLYDTDGTAYGDQLTTTSSSPTRVGGAGSTNIWSSLTSGKTYTLRVKVSEDDYSMYVYGAKLIIVQSDATNITKTESYYHLDIMGQSYSDASYTQTYNYNQFNPGNWGPNTPTYYFEAINARNGIQAITGYMQLYNYTDTSEITSFSMSPVQDPPTRTRSSAITMPSATKTLELREYKTGGSSGLYVVASRAIVQSNHTPTVVKLKSFTAAGNGRHVKVDWETASEVDNLGFNLYRSTKKEGSYTKLNTSLIPGLLSSPTGKSYTYLDKKVRKGKLYFYKLEDIDLSGEKTMHGPICVDWNGDGIPDDEQSKKARGLSAGGSSRRSILGSAIVNSPYAEGSRVVSPDTNSFTARQRDDRVLLEWRSGYELNTLGYHLYREENGELFRLIPELVAGSALFAATALPAGNAYAWWDVLATEGRKAFGVGRSAFGVRYWLEELDLSGDQAWCGPVAPVLDESLKIPEHVASALLSRVGTTQSGQQSLASRVPVPSAKRLSASGPIDLQWSLAAGSAIKLSVRERGWYRVTQPELVAAGLDPKVKPRFLQLFVDAVEQPIRVRGQSDGGFGKKDFIEFYAEGLDTLSTDARTYWLVVGHAPGKRISNLRSSRGLEDRSSVPFTVQLRERSLYFSALLNGESNNFFGPTIGTTPVERTLTVPYPDPSYPGDATLTVSLQGVTLKPHQVQVLLNEEPVGEVVFDGKARRQVTMTVPHSTLLDGENLITLIAQGQDLDISVLDTLELTYQRSFTADAEELGFTLSNPGKIRIEGFNSHPIRVADVTDTGAVKLVSGTSVSRNASGYSLKFGSDPGSGSRTFYAFSEAGIKQPAEIRANQASTWHQESQGADLVIISHGNFMESLAPLKTHRESQGLSVALIDVEDLYDEFSYGTRTPQAIKDFLTRASASWQTPPRFVLLVGDASFDPRN